MTGERWTTRLVREQPGVAYLLAVGACLFLTVSAVALPPENVTPNHALDVVIAAVIAWCGLLALVFHRIVKSPRAAPTQVVFVRVSFAFSAEVWGIAERFITGSAVVPWLGFGVAVAALTVIALQARTPHQP